MFIKDDNHASTVSNILVNGVGRHIEDESNKRNSDLNQSCSKCGRPARKSTNGNYVWYTLVPLVY
jgi:hypothetical protein